jgi:hypothetical protein
MDVCLDATWKQGYVMTSSRQVGIVSEETVTAKHPNVCPDVWMDGMVNNVTYIRHVVIAQAELVIVISHKVAPRAHPVVMVDGTA